MSLDNSLVESSGDWIFGSLSVLLGRSQVWTIMGWSFLNKFIFWSCCSIYPGMDVNISAFVVPVKCYSTLKSTSPINFHFVMVFQGILEMLCIPFVDICDAKIINNKYELDWS